MKLTHYALIEHLPRRLLLHEHRVLCHIRGSAYTHKYGVEHTWQRLYTHHMHIIAEMRSRGFSPALEWVSPTYRGIHKSLPTSWVAITNERYPQHTPEYLRECIADIDSRIERVATPYERYQWGNAIRTLLTEVQ